MIKRYPVWILVVSCCISIAASQSPLLKSSLEESVKTDAWDFGATGLNTDLYNNHLTVDIINAWYDASITVGSSGNTLPDFNAGLLGWVGGGNDRIRTTNTSITRFDENIASVTGYTGRLYVNAGANSGRYLTLNLMEDDEITIMAKTDAGGNIVFSYQAQPEAQTDQVAMTSDLAEITFVAKKTGTYHIYDNQGKPSYYRIYRKPATYATITGSVDVTQAQDIPDGYTVIFTNESGKEWQSVVVSGSYSLVLPVGYTYDLSLGGANGYIIGSGNILEVTTNPTTHDISIHKPEIYTVQGSLLGLGSSLSLMEMVFTPDPEAGTTYLPIPVIDYEVSKYSVQLEPGIMYTISATGVNDFYIPGNTITIGNDGEAFDILFSPKPLYNISVSVEGLSEQQQSALGLTFTNLHEANYNYSFDYINDISLRNGTYSIGYSGLDAYASELSLSSNLKVEDENTGKTLVFQPITQWAFDDKVILNGTEYYNGLSFTGNVSNEVAKGHLLIKPDATIKVPVSPGEKIRISYYYSADFSIDGGSPYTTTSGSTTSSEHAEYIFTGSEPGTATITGGSGASTTYITNIALSKVVDYKPLIHVGSNKEYKSIHEALEAIGEMKRESNQRVIVMIDPGNYEEMLHINMPDITLKNAAPVPGIGLLNNGIDIAPDAVRITSYYGHGYNYFSMASNQKWDAELLRVNKENGYHSYDNKGAGTTNGSYWNATVVVSADGFEAEGIIFENSFNQYISLKESQDVLVMWDSGSKGPRPVDQGNTAVQHKSMVERAAAIAITNNTDKVVLNQCRVVGRQDSFFGGNNARVVVYKGAMMGGTDYLFGGMTAVFYKTQLVMNTSDVSTDVSYITAAQQTSGRGYLMYECTIRSATPGIENASDHLSKPGYFGRPWQATTSEVVFYKTTIEQTNFPGFEGKSLIRPVGWLSSLGGESSHMYEYGTVEQSGEDNQSNRATWSTLLTTPQLLDGEAINTFNFTKGNDNWDPLPGLIANDTEVGIGLPAKPGSSVHNMATGFIFPMFNPAQVLKPIISRDRWCNHWKREAIQASLWAVDSGWYGLNPPRAKNQ